MEAIRARQLADALTSDKGDEKEIGIYAYPDGDYMDDLTVEISKALIELAKLKEAAKPA